ncbi:hypothetical protein [Nocardioides bizhenqiangii]|uniref:Uncharacterized protein n=1 Tax=Nocardioides bizhenqiangii TaxID=3095076 RepID=A0ABZ0ZXG5_9ACTN|nr:MULTISPECIES: hypothetical protein [unclassified Nocardioides]MDZ5622519.1 hypothetical protein [Nocardioides sp. HM23]WQQ28322.1 hypothetical protein SHK19_08845 [Nocardioides sp. HM61]
MKRAILVMVVGIMMLGMGATSAGAETRSKSDSSGDAVRQIDITRLTVTNGDHRVVMRIKVRDLRKRGVFNIHYWGGTTGTPPARSAIVSTRLVDGERTVEYLTCDREECEEVRCRGMRLDWRPGADVIVISTRQKCYPRPRRNPDAPAPGVGRFFASAEFSEDIDSTNGLLTVQRG